MGASVTEVGGQSDKNIITGTETGKGKADRSTPSSPSETAGTAGDRGDRGDRGAGAGETEKKIIPVVVDVDEAERKRLERNERRRERYAKEKEANGGTVKPRKVKKKKTNEPPVDTASLNMVVGTLFNVIGSRPNMEHWRLTDEEITSITTPLAGMIAESEALKNIGEFSNQIALVTACVAVFTPRVVLTVSQGKEKKKLERTKRNILEKKNEDIKPVRQSDRKNADDGQIGGGDVPFYGMPLSD